jgi:hypothetical protein
VYSGTSTLTFRRNVLKPSLGSKNIPNEQAEFLDLLFDPENGGVPSPEVSSFLLDDKASRPRETFFLFICGASNDAFSSPHYRASNCRIISEYSVGEDLKGSDHGLISSSVPIFIYRN